MNKLTDARVVAQDKLFATLGHTNSTLAAAPLGARFAERHRGVLYVICLTD